MKKKDFDRHMDYKEGLPNAGLRVPDVKYIPKVTSTKIKYQWYWQCRKCGKSNSYQDKRCKHEK